MTDVQGFEGLVDESGRLREPMKSHDGYFTVLPPSPSRVNHRIHYYLRGERKEASGGRTITSVLAKLDRLQDAPLADAEDARTPMRVFIEEYLDADRIRRSSGRVWSAKHLATQKSLMDRFVTPHIGSMAGQDLTRRDFQHVIDQAPTQGEGRRLHRAVHAMLATAWADGYVTKSADDLLRGVSWQARGRKVRPQQVMVDGPLGPVPEADVPDAEAVARLAAAARELRPGGPYELMVFTAAYSGLRLGELRWLPGRNVEAKEGRRRIFVERQYVDVASQMVEKLPKNEKQRTSTFPERTPATKSYPQGYPLRDELAARAAQAGSGLVFPAPRGGALSSTNFSSRIFKPAAELAKWPKSASKARGDSKEGWVWTWHSLRHVFATHYLWVLAASPQDVAAAAGHASVRITLERYSGGTRDTLDRLDRIGG